MTSKKSASQQQVIPTVDNPFPNIEKDVFIDLEWRHDEEIENVHGKYTYYQGVPYLYFGPRACYKEGDIITWMMSNKATGIVISVDRQGLKAAHDELYKFNTYLWVKIINAEYPDWEAETENKEVPDFVVETVNGIPVSQLSHLSPDWIPIDPKNGVRYDGKTVSFPYWDKSHVQQVNKERFEMRLRTIKKYGSGAVDLFFDRYAEIGLNMPKLVLDNVSPTLIKDCLSEDVLEKYFPELAKNIKDNQQQ